jgi:hypothetical protein
MPLLFFLSAAVLAFAAGCDDVEPPYRQGQQAEQGDTICIAEADTQRNVLLEEYTGIKCGSCPPAANEAERLREEHPGRVVFVSTHAGFFAQPNDDGPYTRDFRTEASKTYLQAFGIELFPRGMINRRPIATGGGQDSILKYTQWAAAVDSYLKQPPRALICVEPSYDTASRRLAATVNVEAQEPLSANHYLIVQLTEDSVIAPQKDYNHEPSDRLDYVHHFILRGMMNNASGDAIGPWGTRLSDAPIDQGAVFSQQFSRVIPTDWRIGQLYIVAYVYDNATRNVLQVVQERAYQPAG